METTYTIKSIADGYIWQFKYCLNGHFVSFEVLSGTLTDKQKKWLNLNYPWQIEDMKAWQTKLKKNFEIKVNQPEVTFDLFWNMYPENKNSVKKTAKERWDKLTQANKIKIILKIPEYIKVKTKANQFFPYAEVFIRQGWWEN